MIINPTVHVTELIQAPIEKIWKFLRDFNGLPSFHPAIKDSKIEKGNPDEVGCVRYLTLETGFVREELLLLDDTNFTLNYSIIENNLGLQNYFAAIRLKKSNNSNTICEWYANFDVNEGIDKQNMIQIVEQNVFRDGFIALANKLQKQLSVFYH